MMEAVLLLSFIISARRSELHRWKYIAFLSKLVVAISSKYFQESAHGVKMITNE